MADALSPADYDKEHQLIEQERMERTGRLDPISSDGSGVVLPKIELPFVRRLRSDQLPTIEVSDSDSESDSKQDSEEKKQ